ncbi:metallopeptidase family protein [Varunaivibrio sulfuroxidans]|uniref:Putative Zn-dependent protease with MMP-like domain n=1 Tax=Varunaivibrio sulfuroxidans TaxID=1773489 RepID=A0A4V2UP69_9PROT|nr:metallopeptidase family protein [Varunaivibrio sulfuroxidans]TCS64771.1 putative Zn-dependent protease with MMP-like domain [Varunaivibrio sulfuroxidans]WES29924.1 metallopeptidase family protein [Varunaivibrio sulfuroxidans]
MTTPPASFPPETPAFDSAPTLDDLERLAHEAFAEIPEALRRHVVDVVFRIDDFAPADVLGDLGLDNPFDLMGLYHGVPLGEKSVMASAADVDIIFLYRRAILDYWCESGESLPHIIRHVLIHEIGHHFGFSDAAMAALEGGVPEDA